MGVTVCFIGECMFLIAFILGKVTSQSQEVWDNKNKNWMRYNFMIQFDIR